MDKSYGKHKILSSLFWKYMERGVVQGTTFLVTVILSRILDPADFGTIIFVTIFTAISNVFIQQGFSMALIQKKSINDKDYTSVFYITLSIAIAIYALLFFTSPYIEIWSGRDGLSNILKVASIALIFGAYNSVAMAILIRKMHFKKLFINSFVSVVLSGVLGIVLAYNGFGVWALVWQQVTNQIFLFLIMQITVRWYPKLTFSLQSIKQLFSFGWKILVSGLLDSAYDQLYNLVIGKKFNNNSLAFFNKGKEFPRFIVINIDSSIQAVMLPAYSRLQDNIPELKKMVRKAISLSSYIVFPLLIGLLSVAEPTVRLIYTEKWLPAVPFLQIYCLAYFFHPINIANAQAINAMGRSDIYLRINIIKKISAVGILLCTLPFGVYVISFGSVLSGVVFVILNVYPNKKLLDYGLLEQLKDILPALLLSLVMGGVIFLIGLLDVHYILLLIIQIIGGITVYFALSIILKVQAFSYLVLLFKDLRRMKQNNKDEQM